MRRYFRADPYIDCYGRGKADHDAVLAELTAAAQAAQLPLLNPACEEIIGDDCWRNSNHMNQRGADRFSRCLARAVAEVRRLTSVSEKSRKLDCRPGGS